MRVKNQMGRPDTDSMDTIVYTMSLRAACFSKSGKSAPLQAETHIKSRKFRLVRGETSGKKVQIIIKKNLQKAHKSILFPGSTVELFLKSSLKEQELDSGSD